MNRLETFGLIAAQAERGEIIFPTSVNAALRLQLALDDPDCHIENAIKLVLGEPQLAARTVALANSAAFNRNGEATVTNVRAAVLRVTLVNPDTALFAAIVHEVGGFYLLSRADEFPGLLDADPENWIQLCEEVVSREVMRKLAIPDTVMDAIQNLRGSLMEIPPASLLDTLLLANQFAPVQSPLALQAPAMPAHEETALDFVLDRATLGSVLQEAADEFQRLSAALLV